MNNYSKMEASIILFEGREFTVIIFHCLNKFAKLIYFILRDL